MKCTNCGNELEEDAVFCTHCGKKIEPEENMQGGQEQAQKEQTTEQPVSKPGKKSMGKIVGAAVIAVIIVAAAVSFSGKGKTSGTKENEKAVVYYKYGGLYYTSNMDKEDSGIFIADVLNECDNEMMSYRIVDGYLYFYSRINSDGSATLCRVELSKLKKNSQKNEQNIEEMDSNIIEYDLLDDADHLVYKKQNGKLMYINGKNEEDIARDVSSYVVTKEHKAVVYRKAAADGNGSELHVYDLESGKDEKVNVNSQVCDTPETADFILYREDNEDGTMNLYMTDINGRNDEIDDGIFQILAQNDQDKSVYYIKSRREDATAYSYVDDPYADGDADVTEPKIRDYLDSCTRDDVYREAAASDNIDFAEFSEDYEDTDDFVWYYMYYSDDDLDLLCCEFNNQYYYYDEDIDQWYKQREDYQTAKDRYDQSKDRIALREALKETSVGSDNYDLYKWEDGKEPVVIAENVNAGYVVTDPDGKLAVYKKNTVTQKKVSIDDISSVSDVTNMVAEETSAAEDKDMNYYYLEGEEKELDLDGKVYAVKVSPDQKKVVFDTIENNVQNLNLCGINGNEIKSEACISEDAGGAGNWVDDKYYYYEDVINNYGDLYCYENGKSEKLISNIYQSANVYEDGICSYYKDFGDYAGSDLRISDKGNETKISNGVTWYEYIDKKRIVYLKDGNLYVYTGKDSDSEITRSVDSFECEVQKDYTFIW